MKNVPEIVPKIPEVGIASHRMAWNFTVNVGVIVAAIVFCYVIRTWKQESSCTCELTALKKQQSETS